MEIKRKTIEVVWIDYDGVKWYPDRKGYWVGNPQKGKIMRLHVYAWEKHNGPVPKGFHVHHKDHNPNNNNIENLELVDKFAHLSMHGKEQSAWAAQNMLEHALPAAIEWHKGPDGREWHKQHYETSLAPKWDEKVKKKCIVCGKEFETSVLMQYKSKFCSNNCKSQYRRDAKLDNVEKICAYCGAPFLSNKYNKQKYCSLLCANRGRSRALKGVKKLEFDRLD